MTPTDPIEFRRSLTILHGALCLGCAMFMGVVTFLWSEGTVPMGQGDLSVLSNVGLAAAVLLPTLAIVLFRQRIRALPLGAPFPELSNGVRAACILHWALIESALFFNLVIFMLSAMLPAAGLALVLLLLLILRAPSEKRIQRWLTGTA
ncbi:MAG: hypothetical protein IT229_07830 [Flavobacteriales bacterium]|nr:hypothetical protein [Flavobacteriales bacterium]